jgi:RNA polymerase sigma-70 factor (ECF subfamily)
MSVAQEALVTASVETAGALERRVTEHYERRGRHLWGLARRLGATDEQAADVVQEAHLRLWRELSAGTYVEDLDAWTFRVAYRLVMDHHRLGRRIHELVGRLTSGHIESVSHVLDDALSIWPMVDRLPARERASLYLRYRADLSFEQIGEVMGITTASARTYASRAVERLRATIGELEEGRDG